MNTNIIKQKQYCCYFHDFCAKKMFEQKRFAGRHLLTFESQKLNYFGKRGTGILTLQCNSYLSHVRSFFKIYSNFLSLTSSYPLLKMFFSTLSFL